MEENLDKFDYMIINVECCLNGSLKFFTSHAITDDILKTDAFIQAGKYGQTISGVAVNSNLLPTLDWYYVIQFSAAYSGSNLKLTVAIGITKNNTTLFFSHNVHLSDDPIWYKILMQ